MIKEFFAFIRALVVGTICLFIIIFGITAHYQTPDNSKDEISQKEYQQLVERIIRYPSYKWLVKEKLDDGIISVEEKKWLDDINSKIERNDCVELYIQRKARNDESISKSNDGNSM